MELWIRSQDKECLMKVNRIDYDYSNVTHRIMVNGYKTLVGTYKTKERAIEVLDEIQRTMSKTLDCIIEQSDNCVVGCNTLVIYEMPKE